MAEPLFLNPPRRPNFPLFGYFSASLQQEAATVKRSKRGWQLGAVILGVVVFVTTEFLHWLLDPDPERIPMRMTADALSAGVISILAAALAHVAWERRQAALRRMAAIAALNDEIRNALQVISVSAYVTRNPEAIGRIDNAVKRIDAVLRDQASAQPEPPAV